MSLSGIQSWPTKTEPSRLTEMMRSVSLPGFFTACCPSGRRTSTPCCSMGVTTMKMISSTRQTSTRGVTLMSPLISSGLPPPAPNAMLSVLPLPLRPYSVVRCSLFAARSSTTMKASLKSARTSGGAYLRLRRVLDEVVDELRGGVGHLHVEAIDLVEEVVVHPDGGNGHEEAEGGR